MPSTLSRRYWQCSCLLSSALSCSDEKYPDCHCTSVILPWIKHSLGRRRGTCRLHPGKLSTGLLAQPRKGFLRPIPFPSPWACSSVSHLSWESSKRPHTNTGCTRVGAMVRESGYLVVTGGTDRQESKQKSKIHRFFFVLLNIFG